MSAIPLALVIPDFFKVSNSVTLTQTGALIAPGATPQELLNFIAMLKTGSDKMIYGLADAGAALDAACTCQADRDAVQQVFEQIGFAFSDGELALTIRKIPPHRRRKELSPRHHAAVVETVMTEKQQDEWLQRAVDSGLDHRAFAKNVEKWKDDGSPDIATFTLLTPPQIQAVQGKSQAIVTLEGIIMELNNWWAHEKPNSEHYKYGHWEALLKVLAPVDALLVHARRRSRGIIERVFEGGEE